MGFNGQGLRFKVKETCKACLWGPNVFKRGSGAAEHSVQSEPRE